MPDEPVAGRDAAGRRDALGQSEVGEVEVLFDALHGDQRVAGLDVAMGQAPRMRGVECVAELCDQLDRAQWLHRTLAMQQRTEVRALDVAHRDVQLAVALARLIDRHDARVINRRGQPRLRQEPRAKARILGHVRRQQLQRHLAPQAQVLGAIHHAHAAATEERLDPVTPELGSDGGSRHARSRTLSGRANPAYARPLRAPDRSETRQKEDGGYAPASHSRRGSQSTRGEVASQVDRGYAEIGVLRAGAA